MKPELKKLFDIIESIEYQCFISPASSISAFLEAVERTNEFKSLITMISDDRFNAIYEITSRISALKNTEFDHTYQHPYDIPIAAYVHVLLTFDSTSTPLVRSMIEDMPSKFWAALVIESHLAPPRFYMMTFDDYSKEGIIIYDRQTPNESFLVIDGLTGKNQRNARRIVEALNAMNEE